MAAKILVFEEDTFLRLSLCMWLEAVLPGCSVIEATTVAEGETLAKLHAPQIYILDGRCLHPSDHTAIDQLKTLAPNTQIIVLTDYDYDVYRVNAIAAGATACVSKFAITKQLPSILAGLLSHQHQNGRQNGSQK